jgi:UDP-N-acetylglucosamine 2-epimerase (non-hydrolysing)
VNRIVTDSITDYFFTTTLQAVENLLKSGISREKIFFVGNTMIDSLLKNLHRLRKPIMWDLHKLKEKEYFLLTLHRPVNVDRPENLKNILHELIGASNGYPVVFPVHPRTMKSIDKLDEKFGNVHLIEPLGYLEFIYLLKHSRAVITDSGGITEEATVLDIPCMTLRDTTERPETCTMGTNLLIGNDPRKLKAAINRVFNNEWKKGCIPDLWDGKASERIIQSFKKF